MKVKLFVSNRLCREGGRTVSKFRGSNRHNLLSIFRGSNCLYWTTSEPNQTKSNQIKPNLIRPITSGYRPQNVLLCINLCGWWGPVGDLLQASQYRWDSNKTGRSISLSLLPPLHHPVHGPVSSWGQRCCDHPVGQTSNSEGSLERGRELISQFTLNM